MRQQYSFVRLVLSSVLSFTAALILGCGGSHPYTGGAITIYADNASIAAGSSTQLHATQYDLLGVTRDISASVTWASSTPSVATVSTSGLLTGVAAGSSTVTATYTSVSGTLGVSIAAPSVSSLALTPNNASLYTNGTQQYTATATYANSTTANVTSATTWSVLPASVATINASGLLTATAPGTFVITATNGGRNTTISGTISNPPVSSIAITPSNPSIPAGTTQQFTATATYADGSKQNVTSSVTWTSSNPSLLSINASGLATLSSSNTAATVTITAQAAGITQTTTVTIAPSSNVTSLVIEPTSSSIATGSAEAHTATAYYSDGSQADVTSKVTWSVASNTVANAHSNTAIPRATSSVATVDQTGIGTAVTPGTAVLQATYGSISSQSTVIVTPATVVALDISATRQLIPAGSAQPLVLTGTFSDGSHQDLSLTANWQSSNPAVATVDPKTGVVMGVSAGNVQFTASFGGLTASTTGFQILPRNLTATVIRLYSAAFAKGTSQQLQLIGIYADGSMHDLTWLATWSSANPTILPVDSKGLAYGLNPGDTQITATALGKSAIINVSTIATTLQSIQLVPNLPRLALGTTLKLAALGTFTTGATADISIPVIWRSSDPSVLTVDGSGRVKSGKVGTATISASLLGVTQSITVTVTNATLNRFTISPTTATETTSTGHQFTATGIFSDGALQDLTHDVIWDTTDNTIAAIDNSGLSLGTKPGHVNVTATFGTTVASAPLTVTGATLISATLVPGNTELPLGIIRDFKLIGHLSDGTTEDLGYDTIWTAPTPTLVTVVGNGQVIGIGTGTGQIAAQHGTFSATTPVNVTNATLSSIAFTPVTANLRRYKTLQMAATGTFSDGFTQSLIDNAVLLSSAPTIVDIGEFGLATGTSLGTANLTATFRGQTVSSAITVLSDVVTSIAITPATLALTAGQTQQLTATATYADGTTDDVTSQIAWTSSNPAVLSIDANGLATAHTTLDVATVTVTATLGTTTQTFTVTVNPASTPTPTLTSTTLTPSGSHLTVGTTQQFSLIGAYSDGTTQNLSTQATWTSSNPAAATVSSTGLITAIGPGTVTISATYNGQVTSTTTQITTATLVSVALSPNGASIAKGTEQQFTIIGTYSDGTTQNLSNQATWTSSSPSVATVSNTGLVTGTGTGPATITATYNGQTATATTQITPATLVSIAVTPATPQLAAGTRQQLTLTGTYTDGTTQNLSSAATWTTSAPTTAIVSPSGLVTSLLPGTATITAQLGSMQSTATITVTSATLQSLALTPTGASFAAGTTQQFTITGTYSDGTTQNLSTQATWTSSNPSVATVSNTGLATGTDTGSVTLTATYNGQTATTTTQITPATLVSITATPTSAHLAAGTTQQLTLTGTYTDGSTQNLSSAATWTTDAPAAATVSTSGLVTSLAPGTANITAQLGSMQSTTTIIATPATIVSVALSPSGASFANGATQQYTITGTFTDGTTQNLSAQATWTSSNPAIATVSSTGLVTGTGTGTVTISSTYGSTGNGQTATTTSQITPATIVSIAVTPTSASFAKGTTQQFHVIATYTDGTTHDITDTATFTSSDPNVLAIASTGLATGKGTGTAQITITAGNQTITTQPVTVTPATIASIAIYPHTASFANGTTTQFTAIATFTDGTTQDVTNQATWYSSNTSAITINASGLAQSGGPGNAQISAILNGAVATTGAVTVTPAALTGISITPTSAQIAKGTTQQFTATGAYTDGTSQDLSTQVSWTSSTTAASIDASGLATGSNTGTAQINATFQGKSAHAANLTVTNATLLLVTVNPALPSVAAGTTTQIQVTGHYSDGTTQDLTSTATYTSSNPSVATASSTGLLTGVAPGITILTITTGSGITTVPVTVTNATLVSIAITPTNPPSFAKGTTQQFTATGTFSDGSTQNLSTTVTWTSSNPTVFTIDANGLATGTGVGSATLTATKQGQTATTPSFQVTPATVSTITLTPANASIAAGATQQYTATATYTDATTQDVTNSATWSSTNTSAATISGTGLATAIAPGNTTISAQSGSTTGTTPLTVAAATLTSIAVSPASASLAAGTTQQLTLTGTYSDGSTQNLTSATTWTSSNPSAATVSSTGLVTAANTGSATITAHYGGMQSTATITVTTAALQSVALTPTGASFAAGTTQQFTITGTYSDGSTQDLSAQATWTSSNPSVATISSTGLATGTGTGSVTISATYNGQTATTAAQVAPATLVSVAATPTSAHLAAGTTQQLTFTGTYSDGSTQNLTSAATWTTDTSAAATVSATGLVTSIAPGTANITAQLGSMQSTATIVVSAATLQSVSLSPSGASFANGATQQLTITGTFTDGTTQNLSTQATWTSSNPAVATVSSTGLVTGTGVGNVTISSTYNGQTATTTAQITPAIIVSITVTPQTASFAKGTSQQYTVTATYSDGTTHDVTNQATFASSDPNTLSVSSTGLATGMGTGSAQLTVTVGSQTTTTQSVTVTPATIASIAIFPNTVSFANGTTTQFTAIATFTDGTTQDISTQAVWTSSNPSAITINASGLAQSGGVGTAQISATLNGTTATSGTITVTPATLTGIVIAPSTAQVAKGTTQQFTATGTYTDGTSQDLSTQVAWTSSNPTAASIDANGLATGNANGTAQINATFQGKSANAATLTVTNAILLNVTFNPAAPSVAAGTATQVTVIGHFSDGATQDLTSTATFSSANPAAATVSTTGLVTGVAPGLSLVTVTANGTIAAFPVTVTNATLVSIAITPTTPQPFAKGTTQQFTATGTYTDGSTQNLSTQVTWTSSDPAVFTIDHNGLATGTGVGSASLTATFGSPGNVQTATTPTIQVTPATVTTITVLPANQTLVSGSTVQYTATANYTDATTQDITAQVTWTSSNPGVALISSGGLALAGTPGTTTITATNGSLTGSTTLTTTLAPVTLTSVTLTPANAALTAGSNQQYTATAHYSDNSTQDVTSTATWTSTFPVTATVASTGLVTAIAAGVTTINATYQGTIGATILTVTAANATLISIVVTPANPSLAAGTTQQFTATATYSDSTTQNVTNTVTWISSTANAIILPTGLATAVLAGNSTISATLNGTTGSTTLTVTALVSIAITPAIANVAKGNTQQFAATATYTDGSTQNVTNSVTWQSSVPAVATIDTNGLATGVNGGATQIWAAFGGTNTMVTMTVSPATLVSLAVTPATVSLANGTSQQYKATGTMTDGSTQDLTLSVIWSSSNTSAATIDLLGFATTHNLGSTTITATAGSVNASAAMTVTAATPTSVQLTPAVILLPAGGTQQLLATAMFSDGTSQNVTTSVTYASSSPSVATVDANGKLTAASAGASTITATLGSVSTTATATITTATLSSIAITPANPTLAAGASQQLVATGTYTDGSTQDLTHSVLWTSSDPLTSAVSLTGNVTAILTGTATINASFLTINGSTTVTVTSATITAISVTPATVTIASGQTQQFTATATLSNLTQQDVTSSVSWSVSDPTKATITGNSGLLSTTAPGLTNVTATLNGTSGSAAVTIQPAVLTGLTITPSPLSMPAGTTQQLTVTGHYTDGSTQDVTASATYLSSRSSAASVNSTGMVHAVATGSATITATIGLISQNVSTTVTNAILSSIAITPSAPTMPAGVQTQLTATGTYTDGTTQNITTQVQWNSSSSTVATIGSTGLISSLTVGSSTITATLNSVSQTAPLTVTAATLQSIAVTAAQSSFALGLSLQLTATGTYSDGSTRDLTATTTWSSQSPSIGVVNSTGLATGVTTGSFNARATTNGITGTLSVTVLNAVLQSIVVTPSNATIVNLLGTSQQYTATGHFSDGSTQNITSTAHWSITSGLGLGSISSTGSFSPVAVGLGTITATSGTISGSTGFLVVSVL